MDCLVGKTNLIREWGSGANNPVRHYLEDGWTITACSLTTGNIEAAESPKVVLRLTFPPERVFGSRNRVAGKSK
jgi:hypothetical protein